MTMRRSDTTGTWLGGARGFLRAALLCLAALAVPAYVRGGGTDDPVKKLAELREKASEGDIDAQRVLGARYLDGDGVLQNYDLARHWLSKAAKRNDATAQLLLAKLWMSGKMGGYQGSANVNAYRLLREGLAWRRWGSVTYWEQYTLPLWLAYLGRYEVAHTFREGREATWWNYLPIAYRFHPEYFVRDEEDKDKGPRFRTGLFVAFNAPIDDALDDAAFDALVRCLALAMEDKPDLRVVWDRELLSGAESQKEESFLTWAVWSLHADIAARNRPFTEARLIRRLLQGLGKDNVRVSDIAARNRPFTEARLIRLLQGLGKDNVRVLLEEPDATGTLPLYLAISLKQNAVAKEMLACYSNKGLWELRGKDPTGNKARRITVRECANLAGNTEIAGYLERRLNESDQDSTRLTKGHASPSTWDSWATAGQDEPLYMKLIRERKRKRLERESRGQASPSTWDVRATAGQDEPLYMKLIRERKRKRLERESREE